MSSHANRALLAFALVVMVMAGSGCSTTTGGGGGSTSTGLAEYQLDGSNPELEADVAAIAAADSAALVCIDVDDSFTDQETLDELKRAYAGAAAGFPDYVADVRVQVERRSDEICTTQLGDEPDLDAAVARLTVARNRDQECKGDEPDVDDENSLLLCKWQYAALAYTSTGLTFENIVVLAEALADAHEQAADDACADN